MIPPLTRRQESIHDYLLNQYASEQPAPTLDQLCDALGLSSRGSMHLQVKALIDADLVEPMNGKQRGVRLKEPVKRVPTQLPLLGTIVAGQPIEAIEVPERIEVPAHLRSNGDCFVLRVKGDSMIEDGILDGDWVVVERREHARNGEIVVALIDGWEATLKRIYQQPGKVVLAPANGEMEPITVPPERVQIQGVVVSQMRSYG